MSPAIADDLRSFLAKSKFPSSPALAARILKLADDPDSSLDDFAEAVQMDATLSARLLGMTNAAAFGQRAPVTTIQRAIGLLGINRVRTVALGFQLVGHLNRLGKCPFHMQAYWQRCVLRGCLARALAGRVAPAHADEAFLVGLLQDCGTLLLVQMFGPPYAELCRENLSPLASLSAERNRFPHDHVEATAALAREWQLPGRLVTLLEQQHVEPQLGGSPTDDERMCAVSFVAGSVPWTSTSNGPEDQAVARVVGALGLPPDAVDACVVAAAATYQEMAQILGDIVPADLDVTDLLSEANAHLTAAVQSERDQAAHVQAHLEKSIGDYRERAARDPLTDVLNRGSWMEAVHAMMEMSRAQESSVSIFFVDVDNFKRLNDTFGHRIGDEVLLRIAETLQRTVSTNGVVGRYGGEEFVIAVANRSPEETQQLAEAVVRAVEQVSVAEIGLSEPVTCSLGAIRATNVARLAEAGLVHAADELMYTAKRGGKNRACFRALGKDGALDVIRSCGAESNSPQTGDPRRG